MKFRSVVINISNNAFAVRLVLSCTFKNNEPNYVSFWYIILITVLILEKFPSDMSYQQLSHREISILIFMTQAIISGRLHKIVCTNQLLRNL